MLKGFVESPNDAKQMCYSKKRYPTAALADEVAQKCRDLRGKPLRVYQCPLCVGFHLTKMRRL